MGEKRKGRMTNNERTSKKEKKTNNSIVKSASNDDIEEQSSMHSNSSNSDSTTQQPSVTQEVKNLDEIEELPMISSANVENILEEEDPIESNPLISSQQDQPVPTKSVSTNKSWWSSFVRLFHFGTSTIDSKAQIDPQTSTLIAENYLSNVKPRRSLHGNSVIGSN